MLVNLSIQIPQYHLVIVANGVLVHAGIITDIAFQFPDFLLQGVDLLVDGFQFFGIGNSGLFYNDKFQKNQIFAGLLQKMCIFAPKVGWKMCVKHKKLGMKMCLEPCGRHLRQDGTQVVLLSQRRRCGT